ncbi:hypothetical protein POM88_019494 [Heracleum sosnowskyi]|uniref:Uncharacterized protein n=1 Tax=Heracleum sosnowskyi TaxID=360622 RepID=A0AAD8I9S2_9APIA|nr:hypothetical protein POM88_019494 [Heracleum sosnowskyi]
MGSMGGINSSRLEMFRINSSVDDQRVDQVQHVADKFNHMVMNKECSGDKFASVPTRPRTPRVLIENQTYNFEKGVYYCSDLMIVDEKNSSPSKKHSRVEDFVVSEDGGEDFVVSDDHDYEEEESCSKKKQRKVERMTTVPRKPAPVYNLPSELPQNLQEYINGLNLEAPPLFVAQKLLTVTDVTAQQGRLLLPRSLINAEFFDNFLTQVEMDLLDTEAIEVNLVDDKLREFYDLRMKRWVKTSNKDYVLQKSEALPEERKSVQFLDTIHIEEGNTPCKSSTIFTNLPVSKEKRKRANWSVKKMVVLAQKSLSKYLDGKGNQCFFVIIVLKKIAMK